MASKVPNLLYSTNSALAYRISRQFYDDLHYVWCSTKFGSPDEPSSSSNPASSKPFDRFKQLKADTGDNPDRHSAMISAQKIGLRKGAEAKFKSKAITKPERNEIFEIIDQADITDFKPVMYLIPYLKVEKIARKVPVSQRAHPLSDEWIINELPGSSFDVITF